MTKGAKIYFYTSVLPKEAEHEVYVISLKVFT